MSDPSSSDTLSTETHNPPTQPAFNYSPTTFHLSYGVNQPAIPIEPGIIISTWFPDFHGQDASLSQIAGQPNPLAGPFYVPGAMPGDTLSVTIHSLTPNRSQGYACKDIHPNMQHPPLPISARRREYVTWHIDTHRQTATPLGDFFPDQTVEIPLRPVLGSIGVARNLSEKIPSRDCGIYGGNMDYPRIAAGSTLHLPVFVEGGFLCLGDGHALQGAGEITGNGIEVSCDISFSVRVNQLGLQWPAGEDAEFLYTIVNCKPLEQAARAATAQMVNWLRQSYGMNHDQVGILLGQLVRYELGNLVSNAYTVACCFPKSGLPNFAG